MRIPSSRRARRSGFTLVEIMLVVVIIGLIAAVGLPKIFGETEKARINTARAQIVNLATAVRRFEMDIGSYPSSLDQLVTSSGSAKWEGPYLESAKIPKDPWDQDYSFSTDGKGFEIKSNGPPGKSKVISSRD